MSRAAITKLNAEPRRTSGSAEACRLRRRGLVPAVLYGHGEGTVHLAVSRHDLALALGGGAKVVTLETPSGTQQALVKEVQYDAIGTELLHVDFARIALDEAITVEVPVELHGALAEAGVVNLLLHSLSVRCRADRIPERVRVELTGHKPGDVLRVAEVQLPDGVAAALPPDAVVVAIEAPTEVEEAVVTPVPEAAEPEVITARKEKEEEAAPAEEKGKPAEKGEKK